MKKHLLTGIIGGLLVLSAGVALAQPMGPHHYQERQAARNYNIQSRIDVQERQIRHGMRNGDLNRREVQILRDNLNQIRRGYRHATRDGRVDRAEMARLDDMLNRNDHMIRRMANNDIRRF
ncbi:MAG: hypothetical protein H6R01_1309 [Burkholderiaceae bacterium]|nr:hypothetical protein [Burkholderiaceae bacterium]